MPTDRDLIRQTLTGNQGTFGELVRKYQSAVYAQAMRQVHNPQDAEELTQDVFLKAYQNLNQLRDADRFAGWLKRIVSNECASWLRQHSAERQACEVDSDLLSELPSQDAAPDGALIQRELRQAILQAIDSLPALDRAVAKSFYIDQLSYEEISDQHGLSHSAIPRRLHKAKGRIAQRVKQSLSSFVWVLQRWETFLSGGIKTMPVILMKAITWIAAVSVVGFGTTPLLNWFDELTQEQDKGIIITLLDSEPEKDAAEKPKIEPKKKEEEKPEKDLSAQKREGEAPEQKVPDDEGKRIDPQAQVVEKGKLKRVEKMKKAMKPNPKVAPHPNPKIDLKLRELETLNAEIAQMTEEVVAEVLSSEEFKKLNAETAKLAQEAERLSVEELKRLNAEVAKVTEEVKAIMQLKRLQAEEMQKQLKAAQKQMKSGAFEGSKAGISRSRRANEGKWRGG
ncbi:sigma-70 family RNA polymerase sigma factor [Candidatus Poribacteria bacterium]|nr:sigma-70 family RNA polymerase sigma factor [Candidatus Poribacteria bacterium]